MFDLPPLEEIILCLFYETPGSRFKQRYATAAWMRLQEWVSLTARWVAVRERRPWAPNGCCSFTKHAVYPILSTSHSSPRNTFCHPVAWTSFRLPLSSSSLGLLFHSPLTIRPFLDVTMERQDSLWHVPLLLVGLFCLPGPGWGQLWWATTPPLGERCVPGLSPEPFQGSQDSRGGMKTSAGQAVGVMFCVDSKCVDGGSYKSSVSQLHTSTDSCVHMPAPSWRVMTGVIIRSPKWTPGYRTQSAAARGQR